MSPILMTIAIILVIGVLLSRLARAQAARLRAEGLIPKPGEETEEHVDRLLQRGHKIQAIKVYRALHGVGLKEAKEAVERRQGQLPPSGPPPPIA